MVGSRVARANWPRKRKAIVATLLSVLLAGHGPNMTLLARAQTGLGLEQSELDRYAEQLEGLGGIVETVLDVYPTESFDVLELSLGLGWEPADVVGWMKENVAWVPYHGALRSADGVLLDRRGNSLDQALLLAELLDLAGYDARLAHAELDPGLVTPLLDAVMENSLSLLERDATGEVDTAVVYSVAERLGVSADEVDQQRREASEIADRNGEKLRSVASDQTATLMAAMPQGSAVDERGAAVAALADHWWVQYDDGSGWTDTDTVFTSIGEPVPEWLPEPSETYAPTELPQDLWHSVSVSVVAERWSPEGADEAVALEFTFTADEMPSRPISLSFTPLSFASGGPAELSDDEYFLHIAREEQEWLPVLKVDDETHYEASILVDGTINANPNQSTTGRKLADAVSGLGGLGSEPGSEGVLSAVWLDYTLHVPGEDPDVIRRQVVDVMDEDVRRAGSPLPAPLSDEAVVERGLPLLGTTQILPTVSWFSDAYVEHLVLTDILSNIEPAISLARLMNEDIVDPNDPRIASFADLEPLPVELYQHHLARSDLSQHSQDVYIDRPNIVARHSTAAVSNGEVVFMEAIDIVANDVGVMPVPGADPYRSRVQQGVVDTLLEVAAGRLSGETTGAMFSGLGNAASMLYRSDELALDWLALRPGEEPEVDWGEHDPGTAGRIRSALERGQSIYMPKRGIAEEGSLVTSWWEIDPVTGQTLGIGPKGWGQSALETAILNLIGKPLLVHAARSTIRATLFCTFAAATAVVAVGIAVTAVTVEIPMFGVVVYLAGQKISVEVLFAKVFEVCLERALFKV